MKQDKEKILEIRSPESTWLWAGPLVFMLTVSLYFLLRYTGHWAESDSASFTHYIRVFAEVGRIVPTVHNDYPNGYAYQAISTFILGMTGLNVDVLQQWIYPLLAVLVVLPAWILYRELTGSNRGAALTTILLFTQPEFLFVLLRSSHEKFTRALMMLCLFFLARSFRPTNQPGKLRIYAILSYVTTYTLISSNNLLASSFFFAIAVAFLFGWILTRINHNLKQYQPVLKQLLFSALIGSALSFLFAYFIYPPALHNLGIFEDVKNRISALFLDVNTQPTNAYAQVSLAWINLPIYFLLSIANWLILAGSLLIWLWQGWQWVVRRQTPKTQMAWLLWLLYAAFAFQGGLSALVDASGALSSNLQHRIFPSFSMIAVAVIGAAIAEWRPRHFSKSIAFALTAVIFLISIGSVFKATNEPMLSNKWDFYNPHEMAALRWGDLHLENTQIWTEFDERLNTAYETVYGDPNNKLMTTIESTTRNLLITDLSRLRSSRIRQPLPVPPDALQVYDNGLAQLYHLQPKTAFQR